MSSLVATLVAAMVVVLYSSTVWAAIEDSIGVGPHDTALGGSYAARSGTYEATYYNPANLATGRGSAPPYEVAVGTVYAQPFVRVEGVDGRALEASRTPSKTRGFQVGGRFELALVEGLSLGVAAYLPPEGFQFSIRPDDQLQWFGVGDDNHFSANAALGWRLLPWLSVGVGARLLFDIEVVTTARVTDVEVTQDEEGETSFETSATFGEEATIRPRLAPLIGVAVTPTRTSSVGLSYRGRQMVRDFGSTQIDGVPGLPALGYSHSFVHFFEPHRLTVAVAQGIGPISVSADLTYARWSDGLTTNRNFPGLGFFGDTFSPAVGMDWSVIEGFDVLAGYRYSPAPWDNFGGRSNVLSNDEHVTSAGMVFDFRRRHPSSRYPVSVSWAMRLRSLVRRTETKDWRAFESDAKMEANPGFPGYTYGGLVVASSIGLEVEW